MAQTALAGLLHYLRSLHNAARVELSDRELLRQYVANHDEAAFAALLHRHAPLVWSVCRRLLDNEHDAEDAFQAVFLVLLRKSPSLRVGPSLASWLHSVATRIALKSRVTLLRRLHREKRAVMSTSSDPYAAVEGRDLRVLLDEELDRLPEKYRAPLVLCYLEGMKLTEAARQLGWREGTLCGRLARARELLRKRLSRRGLTLSGAALAAALTESATAPATTVSAAVRMAALFALGQTAAGTVSPSVATLAQCVLHTMTVAKLKTALALVVALGLFAAGAGWTAHWVVAEKPQEPKPAVQTPKSETASLTRKDYYGDPLPPGALARMGSVQLRHEKAYLAFSADGKTLISAGRDATVRFWDMATGRQLRQTRLHLPKPSPRRRDSTIAGLSPDGKVVAAFDEEAFHLYDATTGEKLRRLPAADFAYKSSLTFSADGKRLAALVSGDKIAIRLWELPTGKERFHLLEKPNEVLSCILSPDGKLLAFRTADEMVHLLDTATGRELAKAPGKGWELWCFAFSPDGKLLAAATNSDGKATVTLWETAGLKKRATLQPLALRELAIEAPYLTFSPDGKLLVLGGLEALVIWDIPTAKECMRLDDHWAKTLLFAPDGKTLACAGEFEIRLWDLGTGQRLHARAGHDSEVNSVAVSPDGRKVASVGWFDPIVRLWDAATGKPLSLSPRHDAGLSSCAFTSDGRLLLSGFSDVVRLLDASTGVEQRRFVVKNRKTGQQDYQILASHLSTDGKRLAVVSGTPMPGLINQPPGQLTLFDARTGELLVQRVFKCWHSSFTPDGEAVTVDGREQLTIEETRTGRQVAAIAGHLGNPKAFSSDGKFLAVGMHKTVGGAPGGAWTPLGLRVIEMASREEIFHVDGWIDWTAFSPDGRRLVTADPESLRLWDVETGDLLLRRPWPANSAKGPSATPIHSLAFLPNGRAVVTGMNDGTLLVWDMTPSTRSKKEIGKPLTDRELEVLWSDLASGARQAHRAVSVLAASPKQALPFLAGRLRPVALVDPKRVDRLLADLDSEQFAVRETAARQLEDMGSQIEPALRRVLAGKPSLEVRNRVRAIQDELHGVPPSATLRNPRAIHVLEGLATEEARELLKKLTTGAAEARLTRAAKAALERLR